MIEFISIQQYNTSNDYCILLIGVNFNASNFYCVIGLHENTIEQWRKDWRISLPADTVERRFPSNEAFPELVE